MLGFEIDFWDYVILLVAFLVIGGRCGGGVGHGRPDNATGRRALPDLQSHFPIRS